MLSISCSYLPISVIMCLEAIESGHLPGDILDDIPAKFVDGALICEVRDYQRCSSDKGAGIVSVESSPAVNKVCLKMSLENIVKDIPSLTDKSWTYGNIMEVESKILKALQPNLHLDPTPNLDRLCESPLPTKLNLQRKRLRNIPEFAVTSTKKIRGKKVRIDRVKKTSNSRLGDSRITTSNAIVKQPVENPAMQNLNPTIAKRSKNIVPDSSISGFSMKSHQSRYPIAVGTPRSLQEHGSISGINSSGASAAKDVMILYADNPNASVSLHVKRDNPDGQSSPLSNIAKRMKEDRSFTRPNFPQSTWISLGQEIKKEAKKEDRLQKRKHLQSPHLSRGTLPHSPLSSKSGTTSNGSVGLSFGPFPMNTAPGALQKEKAAAPGALQLAAKQISKSELEMDARNLDPQQLRLQQRMPQHAFTRHNVPQLTWNSLGQKIKKEAEKEDQFQKMKHVQSPRLSRGTLPNTHFADLLADQYSSQIEHEGYVKEDDGIQLRPNLVNLPFVSQSSLPPNEMQQYGEPIFGQSCNEAAKLASSSNVPLNVSQYLVENASMFPPENPQALQMSQEFPSGVSMENRQALQMSQAFLSGVSMSQRPHQQEVQQLQQNQHSLLQQQNQQFQRSLLNANKLSHLNEVGQNSNMPLGNHLFHHHESTMGVPLLSQQTHLQASPQQTSQQTLMSPQQMRSNYRWA